MIAIISLTISFIVLVINLYLAWVKQPTLKFAKADSNNEMAIFFRKPDGLDYPKCTHIACFKIHLYNVSSSPVTISEFSLESQSGKSFFRNNTEIGFSIGLHEESYMFYDTRMELHLEERKIKLPLVMEPYGYHEGYIVFPYIKDFCEKDQDVVVRAHTAYKNFPWKVKLRYCKNLTLIECPIQYYAI